MFSSSSFSSFSSFLRLFEVKSCFSSSSISICNSLFSSSSFVMMNLLFSILLKLSARRLSLSFSSLSFVLRFMFSFSIALSVSSESPFNLSTSCFNLENSSCNFVNNSSCFSLFSLFSFKDKTACSFSSSSFNIPSFKDFIFSVWVNILFLFTSTSTLEFS